MKVAHPRDCLQGAGALASEAAGQAPNISVLVLTLNEEVNIERCLRSVSWSNDVVVLDSGSSDATRAIAATFPNVRIVERPFTDFADQRNFGLRLEYRNDWLLVLDADETVQPMLATELLELASQGGAASVYLIRRTVVLDGKPLRWNLTSRFWIERVFRPREVHYAGNVHEKLVFEGAWGRMRGRIHHHQFDKGVEDWLRRRVRYAQLERSAFDRKAAITAAETPEGPLARRSRLKRLFYRLPARWAVYFVISFVFTLPFLDGRRGVRYVLLESYSQFLGSRVHRESGR